MFTLLKKYKKLKKKLVLGKVFQIQIDIYISKGQIYWKKNFFHITFTFKKFLFYVWYCRIFGSLV